MSLIHGRRALLLASLAATADNAQSPRKAATTWGLDHGIWSVLHHLFPNADPAIEG